MPAGWCSTSSSPASCRSAARRSATWSGRCARSSKIPSSPPPIADIAHTLAPFLRQLAETSDVDRFAAALIQLEVIVRQLAEAKNAEILVRIRSLLETIATEEAPGARTRAAAA